MESRIALPIESCAPAPSVRMQWPPSERHPFCLDVNRIRSGRGFGLLRSLDVKVVEVVSAFLGERFAEKCDSDQRIRWVTAESCLEDVRGHQRDVLAVQLMHVIEVKKIAVLSLSKLDKDAGE